MNSIRYIETLADQSPAGIRSAFYKMGILATYADDGRMVMYNSKNARHGALNKDAGCDLWLETNGLVIDTNDMRVLVSPPLSFRSHIDPTEVNTHLKNDLYDVFLINDGTVVNLYYWAPLDSWRIATARGYDMTDTKWGDITYGEILKELIEDHGTSEEEFYGRLNRDSSYTFGFNHSSMHAFRDGGLTPLNRLWFIQSVEGGVVNYFFDGLFGIPDQPKYEFPTGVRTTQSLFKMLNNSLDDFIRNGNVLHGFIMRSRDATTTGYHSHIMLEGALLQRIRNLYYHSRFNGVALANGYDRDKFIIVSAYMGSSKSIFIKLFPHHQPVYDSLNVAMRNLVNRVNRLSSPEYTFVTPTTYLDSSARYVFDLLSGSYNLKHGDRRNTKVITSFIMNNHFIDMLYTLTVN